MTSNWDDQDRVVERSLKAASPTLECLWERLESPRGWRAPVYDKMMRIIIPQCGSDGRLCLAAGWEEGDKTWQAAEVTIPTSWVFPSETGPDDLLRTVFRKLISDALEALPRFQKLRQEAVESVALRGRFWECLSEVVSLQDPLGGRQAPHWVDTRSGYGLDFTLPRASGHITAWNGNRWELRLEMTGKYTEDSISALLAVLRVAGAAAE